MSLNTLTVEDKDAILHEADWMLLLLDMISLSQLGDSSLESTLDARSTFNSLEWSVGFGSLDVLAVARVFSYGS